MSRSEAGPLTPSPSALPATVPGQARQLPDPGDLGRVPHLGQAAVPVRPAASRRRTGRMSDPYEVPPVAEQVALARQIAGRHRGGPSVGSVAHDDVESDAMLGVLKAAARYTPRFTWKRYAWLRATGEVLDGQRARGWLPSDSAAMRAVRAGGPVPPAARIPQSLDEMADPDGTPLRVLDPAGDSARRQRDGYNHVLDVLRQHLAPRDVAVVRRTVLDGEYLKDVAADLGITEARVCQLRSAALVRLRMRLTPDDLDVLAS